MLERRRTPLWAALADWMRELIQQKPDLTLRELKAELHTELSVPTLCAAANRDPAVFTNPERFDVARTPNKHLGFGVGHHQCLCMNLARMELEAALRKLLMRFPRLSLDAERLPVRKCDSLIFRGFARLPVRSA